MNPDGTRAKIVMHRETRSLEPAIDIDDFIGDQIQKMQAAQTTSSLLTQESIARLARGAYWTQPRSNTSFPGGISALPPTSEAQQIQAPIRQQETGRRYLTNLQMTMLQEMTKHFPFYQRLVAELMERATTLVAEGVSSLEQLSYELRLSRKVTRELCEKLEMEVYPDGDRVQLPPGHPLASEG